MRMRTLSVAGVLIASAASASTVSVTIENTRSPGGFSFTPFWVAFHNGGFDSYDGGAPASGFPGLRELAEDGLTGPISAAFMASAAGMAGGVDATITADSIAPPVFSPGESATRVFDVGDSGVNRYFSYASMLIPSNDLFVANGNPFAHQVFDSNGVFLGPIEILIFGSGLNDAGTEVNDIAGGAAFSALGGQRADEPMGTPTLNYFVVDPNGKYLQSILGTQTVTGDTISAGIEPGTLLARITIVPGPGGAGVLALAGLAATRRRR